MKYNNITSIILPCLNEEASIQHCLNEIKEVIKKTNIKSEVIVVDNGSDDNSYELAKEIRTSFPELILVREMDRGYGSAYLKGISVSHGEYIFMADIDNTYNFADMPKFIEKLKAGYGLVVGNRFDKKNGSVIEKSAMPWHHRHIGNPFLSYLVKVCFGVSLSDIHCGMRAISREALENITLRTTGMEFASEMIIKASRKNIRMTEIPITYKKRIGKSKLRSLADGWRHLRFILLYCPTILFLLPGVTLLILGSIIMIILSFSNPVLLGIQYYFHPMFLAAAMIMTGYQFIFFGGFVKIYAATHLGNPDRTLERLFRYITIEKAGIFGITIGIVGFCIYVLIFIEWIRSGFNSINEVKISIIALTLIVIGIESISSAFILSILGIKEKK